MFPMLLGMGLQVAGGLLSLKGASDSASAARMEAGAKAHTARLEALYTGAQLDLQDEQLAQELEEIKLNAGQKVIARMRQANEIHEANVSYIAGAGTGENMSYNQGIREANRKLLEEDLSNIDREKARASMRVSDQIRVNKIERTFSGVRADNIGRYAFMSAAGEAKAAKTRALGNIVQNFAIPSGGLMSFASSFGQKAS
jgi:hypothetical protein